MSVSILVVFNFHNGCHFQFNVCGFDLQVSVIVERLWNLADFNLSKNNTFSDSLG